MLSELKTNRLFVCFIFLLVCLSFYLYAPCFLPIYDSDHAIQTLIAYNFTWPRDAFYWGQNRLGSFLPMITYPLVKLGLHPLWAISLVHYALLIISCIIISKWIRSKWLVAVLFIAVFFPVSNYRAILFVGHPYSVQLFCGVLFLYFCGLFYDRCLQRIERPASVKDHLALTGTFLCTLLFYCLGIWASELSAILILIPVLYFCFDHRSSQKLLKKSFTYIYFILALVGLICFYAFFHSLKKDFPGDELYDTAFFFSPDKIGSQFKYMLKVFGDVLLFRDKFFMENLFYYIVLALVLILIFRKSAFKIETQKKNLYVSLLLTAIITFVLLFFSNWNLRSTFCPRYYIPVYYLIVFSFLFYVDNKFQNGPSKIFASTFILFSAIYSFTYYYGIKGPSVSERFGDFKKLPEGTFVAGYWDAYVIGSVAPYNLKAFAYEDEFVRNWFELEKAMTNKNFYFINNPDTRRFIKNDTLTQFKHSFVFSGEKFNCNGLEVLRYSKVR